MTYIKECPICHKYSDKPFCYKDGAKMIDIPTCQCGYELLDHYKFCPQCGTEVKQNENTIKTE